MEAPSLSVQVETSVFYNLRTRVIVFTLQVTNDLDLFQGIVIKTLSENRALRVYTQNTKLKNLSIVLIFAPYLNPSMPQSGSEMSDLNPVSMTEIYSARKVQTFGGNGIIYNNPYPYQYGMANWPAVTSHSFTHQDVFCTCMMSSSDWSEYSTIAPTMCMFRLPQHAFPTYAWHKSAWYVLQ